MCRGMPEATMTNSRGTAKLSCTAIAARLHHHCPMSERIMHKRIPVSLAILAVALTACQPASNHAPVAVAAAAEDPVARGEYLVRTTGCNDCHTAGYMESQGEVDKAQWLTGSPLGYHGPWGTTYATNLRLRLQDMDEAQWLEYSAHLRARPIMPDFALRAMTEEDRRAIYRFVRSLGPAGEAAPAALPPGQTPPATAGTAVAGGSTIVK
jgi:mono/diheme cytochrome c family protein